MDAEIFVVDNHSVDGSVKMVKEKFPEVILIENKENLGFAKANNQAIRQAKGEYILLLNPDTVVEEDTFKKVVEFMDTYPEAGGLGVKMVDGKGRFLKESKRGLPTPWVAFYKLFGLNRMFPKSRIFNHYHLGFLDENKIHEVEVLAGAFMVLRRSVLDKVGLLDEDYFMYGEDIDLSYRIIRAGYKNYYFPLTRIIHYKGESTKKSSVNYVIVFYKAMLIFARKHYHSGNRAVFSLLIRLAIYVRAGLSMLHRLIRKIGMPVLDVLTMIFCVLEVKNYWEANNWRVIETIRKYPTEFYTVAIPAYVIIWMSSLYFFDTYSKNMKLKNIIKAVLMGTVVISALTFFLKQYAFSRAIILISTAAVIFCLLAIRYIQNFILYGNFKLVEGVRQNVAIAGSEEEYKRVKNIIDSQNYRVIGRIEPNGYANYNRNNILGSLSEVGELSDIYSLNEIIFCAKDLPPNIIIDKMNVLSAKNITSKIAPLATDYVIGSRTIDSPADLVTVDINFSIAQTKNKILKRMFDICGGFSLLMVSPLYVLFHSRPAKFFKYVWNVLVGKNHLVGYTLQNHSALPLLKQGVLRTIDCLPREEHHLYEKNFMERIDLQYAKNYSVWMDLEILFNAFRRIGKNGNGKNPR